MYPEEKIGYLPTDEQMIIWDDFRQKYPEAHRAINLAALKETHDGEVARSMRAQIILNPERPTLLWQQVAVAFTDNS